MIFLSCKLGYRELHVAVSFAGSSGFMEISCHLLSV